MKNYIKVRVIAGILLAGMSNMFPGLETETDVHVTPGTTVGQLLNITGIPREYVSFPAVNGERTDFLHELQAGDEVIFFPYVAGG